MADYQMGGGYIEGETEEEYQARKRREAEAAAAMAPDNIDMGGGQNFGAGAATPGMGDILSRAFDNRIQAAGNRVQGAINQFENPQQALQQRLGVAQPVAPEEAANTEVQSQQVKTYADGSQEHTVKTSVPAPAQPEVAPAPQAVAQPAPGAAPASNTVNPQAQAAAIARMQAAAQATQPAPQPAPAGPAIPQGLVAGGGVPETPNIGQVPQPGPAVQAAGPVNPAVAPTVQQAPAGAPGASLAQAGQVAQTQTAEPAWVTDANAAGNDFNKLLGVLAKHPEAEGPLKEKLFNVYEGQKKADEAAKLFKAAENGDLKAWNKIQQEMRPERGKQKEEVTTGDYVRAYMYARLGLNDLSQEVQQKILGKETKFGQVQLGGTNWSVETDNKTGQIIRAKDDEGNIATKSTIDKLAAAGMKAGTHAYSQTGEIHITPDNKQVVKTFNGITGKPAWVEVDSGTEWHAKEGMGNPKPMSIGTAIAKKEGTEAVTLRYAGPISYTRASAGFAGKFNTENPGANIAWVSPGAGRAPVLVDRNNGDQVVNPDAKGNITVVKTPVTTPAVAPAPAAAPAASGTVNPTPGVPGTTPPPTYNTGESPTQYNARVKQWSQEQAKVAADQAKLKSGLPEFEGTAENTLRTLADVTSHPGFKISVGGSQPIGSLLAKVPNTEARDWQSKYNQLKGQAFLSAFNSLRGGGAITDTEGAKATQAMAALNDPGISEKEFLRNAKILEDTIKTGVNRRREQAGLTPKYVVGESGSDVRRKADEILGR